LIFVIHPNVLYGVEWNRKRW